MFNFGFLELMTLAVIGLIVLGPEQFPKAARGLLRVINEIKRAFSEAKVDFDDIKGETAGMLKKAEEEFLTAGKPFEDLKEDISSLTDRQEERTNPSTADQRADTPSEASRKSTPPPLHQPESPEKALDKNDISPIHQTKNARHNEGTADDGLDGACETEDSEGIKAADSSSDKISSENPPNGKKASSASSVNHPAPENNSGKRENKDG